MNKENDLIRIDVLPVYIFPVKIKCNHTEPIGDGFMCGFCFESDPEPESLLRRIILKVFYK